ncbi:hypothetical protein BGX29_005704 [Mortierella sp. GBA35]|nr:hypothetical protein BGX29_005704 [Mortierella sp. GBA35]
MSRHGIRTEEQQLLTAESSNLLTQPAEPSTTATVKAEGASDTFDAFIHDIVTRPAKRKRRTKKQKDIDNQLQDLTEQNGIAVQDKGTGTATSESVSSSTQNVATKPAKKKRRTKTQHDDNQFQDDTDQHGLTEDESGPRAVSDKQSSMSKKKKTTDSTTAVDEPPPTTIAPTPMNVINRSDPCAVLPTEIWHQILSYLPFAMVAKASTVSRGWLDGARSHPIWRTICEKGELGEPKRKYKTDMALVCANSYWICDYCLSISTGRPRPSNIPLPVPLSNDKQDVSDEIWTLCSECRREHYEVHPESFRTQAIPGEEGFKGDVMKATRQSAYRTYGLHQNDLCNLSYYLKANPWYRRGWRWPLRIYKRYEVQDIALQTHAGWVGVDAVRHGIARKRHEAAKERSRVYQLLKRANK